MWSVCSCYWSVGGLPRSALPLLPWIPCCALGLLVLLLLGLCLLPYFACVLFTCYRSVCCCPAVGRGILNDAVERQRGGSGEDVLDRVVASVKGGTAIPRRGAREAQRWVVAVLPGSFLLVFALLASCALRYDFSPHPTNSNSTFAYRGCHVESYLSRQKLTLCVSSPPAVGDGWRRIGEAKNPGPFTYGGASSSTSSGGRLPAANMEVARDVKEADASRSLVSRFDDADDWAFGVQEEVDGDPWAEEGAWQPELEPQEAGHHEGWDHKLQEVDDALAAEYGELERGRLSAMALWEVCPALVEGVIELPAIEEDQKPDSNEGEFYTVEGWRVRDPQRVKDMSTAASRGRQLGISGLASVGMSSSVNKSHFRLSPQQEKERAWRRVVATLPVGSLEPPPKVEEEKESQVKAGSCDVQATAAASGACGGQEQTVQRKRRRGKRRRSEKDADKAVSIWTYNTSGAPQLRAAASHCRSCASEVPVALLNQEHHTGEDRIADLQAQLKRDGWRMAAAHATRTEAGGWSAGVAVCTPAHVAAGLNKGMQVDCSPPRSPGRVAAIWLQQVAPGGIMVVSCYLHDVEHGSARNVDLLIKALSVAADSGCPWVLGLDAQEEPEDFLKWAAPVIERCNGVIAAPSAPTHYPGVGQARCIDYFIVDKFIAEAVQSIDIVSEFRCHSADADYTVAAKPHRAVKMVISKRYTPPLMNVLRLPKAFPKQKPIGCARAPVIPKGSSGQLAEGQGATEEVSGRYAEVVKAVEDELCGICDAVKATHRGREMKAEVVARPAVPRRAAGPRGHMSQQSFANVWGLSRIRELLELSRKHLLAGLLTAKQEEQWRNLVRKLCSPSAPIACAAAMWDTVVQELQAAWLEPGRAASMLQAACHSAEQLVEAEVSERRNKRMEGWRRWKKAIGERGGQGGILFGLVKRTEECPDLVVTCRGHKSATPQVTLEEDFKCWDKLWSKLKHLEERPWTALRPSETGDPLPRLGHAQLRAAARSFKATTATGVDALAPVQFGWLSDPLLDQLGLLLESIEERGRWPSQIGLAMVHLIPKASGGRRPIGLLASLVRLWERARKPEIENWRSSCRREYNWMCKGKGAERSAWAQNIYEEAAVASGRATASILLDLVKAFEQVVLGQVWRCGARQGFPRRILVLALEACAFARRLSYRGAVSSEANTATAILAGGGMATDLLFVSLVEAVDGILRRHEVAATETTLRCYMMVDDIKLTVEGREARVAETLPIVADDAVSTLEGCLKMQVSRNVDGEVGKTVVQTSSTNVGRSMRLRLRRLGVNIVRKVKNLGVQFATGSRRLSNQVSQGRFTAGMRKVNRAARYGRMASRTVLRSVLTPSFTYGSSVTSCSPKLVQQLRVHTARTYGPLEGKSTTARLLMEEADVRSKLAVKTVMDWVQGVWDNVVEKEAMAAALRGAWTEHMALAGVVRGALTGATAYLSALGQMGWAAPSVDCVRVKDGTLLYFGEGAVPEGAHAADPCLIRKWAAEDYEAVAMTASTVAKDMADLCGARGYPFNEQLASMTASLGAAEPGDDSTAAYRGAEAEVQAAGLWRRGRFEHEGGVPVPWLWPARVVTKALKKKGLHKVAASLRALVEGGWPTQFRLFCHKRATHAGCACGKKIGTLRHKLGECELSGKARELYCPEWLRRAWSREAWHPLFARGVPVRPKAAEVPRECSWVEVEKDDTECADIYTDGSARGYYWRATRGGWSVVALDKGGRHLWTRRGVLGGVNVSSHRAELRALLEAIRVGTVPLRIHVDNQSVVDGIASGRESCTSSKAADADLWRVVWDELEVARARGCVDVLKVKAHTTWLDVLHRRISPRDQYGNWLADHAAKACAQYSENQAPTRSINIEVKKAVAWLRWAARCAADWTEDIEPAELSANDQRKDNVQEGVYAYPHLRHELWAVGARAVCRRCGLSQLIAEEQSATVASRCNGSAAGRAAAQATGNINHVWAQSTNSREALLQQGAKLLSAEAPPRWMVDLSSLGQLARSEEHLRELTRALAMQSSEDTLAVSVPPWFLAPTWLPSHLTQPWELPQEALRRQYGGGREPVGSRRHGHRVAFTAAVAFCTRCACFAQQRVGSRFKGECVIPQGRASAAVAYRLQRLRGGRHPITGKPLKAWVE